MEREDCNKKPDNNVAAAKSGARSRQQDTRVKYFPPVVHVQSKVSISRAKGAIETVQFSLTLALAPPLACGLAPPPFPPSLFQIEGSFLVHFFFLLPLWGVLLCCPAEIGKKSVWPTAGSAGAGSRGKRSRDKSGKSLERGILYCSSGFPRSCNGEGGGPAELLPPLPPPPSLLF